jgi:hypothetical protein
LYVSRGARLLNLGIFYNYRSSPHFWQLFALVKVMY